MRATHVRCALRTNRREERTESITMKKTHLVRPMMAGATLALAAVLSLGLSACGASGSSAGNGSTAGSTTQASSPAKSSTDDEIAKSVDLKVSKDGAVSFTDDLGNTVTVKKPKHVVACMGSFANAWELAGGKLAAATDDAYENYGVDVDKVASVGRSTSLSLESIMAQDPDFVIATGLSDGKHSTGVSQSDLKSALDASEIPCAFFKVTTFDDYLRMLRIFTAITGRDDLYQKNGLDVQASIEKAVKKYSVSDKKPRVLVMSSYSKGVTAQDSTGMTGAMVKELGATNVCDENPSALTDFSIESIAALDPDYIFVLSVGTDTKAAERNFTQSVESNPAWSELSAVKAGNYKVLDSAHFMSKPNAKWDESYTILGKALAKMN